MDISKITNPGAKRFIGIFSRYRDINREIYNLIPEDKFDFRMVNTDVRKSDSPRESLAHQINVQRSYLKSIENGKSEYGSYYDTGLKSLSKEELLKELDKTESELVEFLSDPANLEKPVAVRWSPTPITAITYLWALNDHEILHNGWNLAIMDHLNIPRFENLRKMWG